MEQDRGEERESDAPENHRGTLEKGGVGVERVGTLVDEKIAGDMPHHESREDDTGHGHHDLLADRGAVEPTEPVHGVSGVSRCR